MVKPELGSKRTCVSCGTRFYDLRNPTPACPKCGTEQPPEQPRLKRGGPPMDDRRLKKPVAAAREEDVDVEAVEVEDVVEDDDDVLDETADLDDDDPIEAEIEVEKDPDERDQ
ncbi:TIGR02300 family protein [Acidisoma sp. C75]